MENKLNSGALFENNKKQGNNSPDFRGQANIGGCEMWVSAWNKVSKAGTQYVSLAFNPKEQQQQGQKAQPVGGGSQLPPEPEDNSLSF